MGAIWTMGLNDAGYPDRGTGYVYFDGESWSEPPVSAIESIRTGWPSYAPYGENGELVVSHDFTNGVLYYLTREQKGTGPWIESILEGPESLPISWNRSITSGSNHNVIHMIYITWNTSYTGGAVYQGLNGAFLYSKTSDGGATWDYQHEILEGITADDYFGFTADNYTWAAPDGDNIAFVVGEFWTDMFLMKSDDNGESWDKTVIFEHPYPLFNTINTVETDTVFTCDGAHHLAFDSEGKVHVVFGISKTVADAGGWYYYPWVDGVGYWNEDMPTFSNDINALSPYGHPDSELIEDENLIGWAQDMDGDGVLTFVGESYENLGSYNVGASSQPQILIDENDNMYVIWSGVTETFQTATQNFRHLWGRGFANGSWGDFYHITNDITFSFSECVFPTIASKSFDSEIHFTFQEDYEPGMSVQGDLDDPTDNAIRYMSVEKGHFIPVGVKENKSLFNENSVSQNSPNPFSDKSYINVEVEKACDIYMEITNITGQLVYATPKRFVKPGALRMEIDAKDLSPGVYFYTVRSGNNKVTKKMIIE